MISMELLEQLATVKDEICETSGTTVAFTLRQDETNKWSEPDEATADAVAANTIDEVVRRVASVLDLGQTVVRLTDERSFGLNPPVSGRVGARWRFRFRYELDCALTKRRSYGAIHAYLSRALPRGGPAAGGHKRWRIDLQIYENGAPVSQTAFRLRHVKGA